MTVTLHQLKCQVKSWPFWRRLILVIAQMAGLIVAVVQTKSKTGAVGVGVFFMTWFLRVWREGRDPNLKSFERNAAERASILYRAVCDVQRREQLGSDEIEEYRSEVLRFIAHYVRDHRRDGSKPTIFANLLIEEGEELVVLARDRDHRVPRARYSKATMLAWAALSTGNCAAHG